MEEGDTHIGSMFYVTAIYNEKKCMSIRTDIHIANTQKCFLVILAHKALAIMTCLAWSSGFSTQILCILNSIHPLYALQTYTVTEGLSLLIF